MLILLFWPMLLLIFLGALAIGSLLSWLLSSPGEKTTKIVILGPSGSGKTELWYALQRKVRSSYSNAGNETIEKFLLGEKSDGTKVYVEKVLDIGGTNLYATTYYKTLITQGTFVYFLLDITKVKDENYKEPFIQFVKVLSVFKEIGKVYGCGYEILATHADEDRTKGEGDVRNYFALLQKKKYGGVDLSKLNIRVVSLKDSYDLVKIRQEILCSVN